MTLPRIRPMIADDVDSAADALLRNDWGDRRANFAFSVAHPGCQAFVADHDGAIAGTGIATLNGRVGWIGTIWVDPAWRRRGVGLALTEATIDAAEGAGCRTLVLVATDAGRPMYERIGFEVQTTYRILEAPGLPPAAPDPRVREFRADDLAPMSALDTAATGEDRSHLLTAFAAPETARCVERADGTLGGFVVRAPWGGGATIASDPLDAESILLARRLSAGPARRVRAGLLAENKAGLERLARDGWVEAWHAPRLVRGEALDWQPAAIWGQFNHAMG
jgi:GNAT superfamily N-acetyltransferase